MKRNILKFFSIACLFALLSSFIFCKQKSPLINELGTTIGERFKLPMGYERESVDSNSFEFYLQHLKLKPHGTLVHYYNGQEKPNKVAAAVLSIDVGNKDLQQCADAVMRLRAEYLYSTKQVNKLHFNFTNGFNALYKKWIEGNRIIVKGNAVNWVATTKESQSYASFKEYLQIVFTYAGTASLQKELKPVNMEDMKIGDVFIKGGSPGHAVIVVDMAINKKTHKKLFMIAQSYMPAQDIHVLVNTNNSIISPWYELDAAKETISTPEWSFTKQQLMRF